MDIEDPPVENPFADGLSSESDEASNVTGDSFLRNSLNKEFHKPSLDEFRPHADSDNSDEDSIIASGQHSQRPSHSEAPPCKLSELRTGCDSTGTTEESLRYRQFLERDFGIPIFDQNMEAQNIREKLFLEQHHDSNSKPHVLEEQSKVYPNGKRKDSGDFIHLLESSHSYWNEFGELVSEDEDDRHYREHLLRELRGVQRQSAKHRRVAARRQNRRANNRRIERKGDMGEDRARLRALISGQEMSSDDMSHSDDGGNTCTAITPENLELHSMLRNFARHAEERQEQSNLYKISEARPPLRSIRAKLRHRLRWAECGGRVTFGGGARANVA